MLTTRNRSIKKPKTSRYPSLKGTDPKFRRNHRHALHGNQKALVGPNLGNSQRRTRLTPETEGGQGEECLSEEAWVEE